MATSVLKDQKIWFDGFDFTGVTNALGLDYGAESLDDTVLGDDTRSSKGGLKTVAASLQGFFDADPFDEALFDNMGAAGKVITFGQSATEAAVVYMFKASLGAYNPNGAVGEMFSFSLNAGASKGPLVRGSLMENNTGISAGANGTGQQLGAVSATQKMYAALHVLNAGGAVPTLDITIESDDNAGFTSATTRITMTQEIALGSQWQEVSGAITDDHWRVVYAIGGGSPDFDFIVSLGIF